MTNAQWADIENDWREWFAAEELPLGGKCPIWQLSCNDVFAIPFFCHDIICKNKTETINGWPMQRADGLLAAQLKNLALKKINWSTRKIESRKRAAQLWQRCRRQVFLRLIAAYRGERSLYI